jgi:hypothetical protein
MSRSHGGVFDGYGDRVRTHPSSVISSFGAKPWWLSAVGEGASQIFVPSGSNWFCA